MYIVDRCEVRSHWEKNYTNARENHISHCIDDFCVTESIEADISALKEWHTSSSAIKETLKRYAYLQRPEHNNEQEPRSKGMYLH